MIDTGLSLKYIYAIKAISAVITTVFFVLLIDAFKKRNSKKLVIFFSVFMFFCISTILIFSLNLRSREEVKEFNKRKRVTMSRAEKLIYHLNIFSKKTGLYPKSIYTLKKAYPAIKIRDAWGNVYSYKSNGITFRVAFAIPNDDGYYFYNSAMGDKHFQGYLFKYMHGKIIK